MGCGSSQPITSSQSSLSEKPASKSNAATDTQVANGAVKTTTESPTKPSQPAKVTSTSPTITGGTDTPVPKSVAFEVNFENNIDNIVKKHAPKRLQRLDPIANAPRLTAEQLLEKQRLADEKRQQQLEAKREVSRKRSKLRSRLQQAKEFENAQKQYIELEEKQKSAGLIREAKAKEQEARRKIREERARRAKEKAKKLQEDGIDEVDFEVEKDENFNREEVDSWLDGDNNTVITNLSSAASSTRQWSGTERVYSGKESPVKPYKPRNSAEKMARMSAGTSDSFDYAFQREPQTNMVNGKQEGKSDNFWDT